MSRRARGVWTWITLIAVLSTGCQPTQPFFYMEDGDLSHYIDVATKIEYPDVNEPRLAEVEGALPPLTVANADNYSTWDLTLEEVTRLTLVNSDVMRVLGGRVVSNAPDTLTRNIVSTFGVTTTYDPALLESAYGANTGVPQSGTGVEAALAEFDAQLSSSVVFQKNDRPQNVDRGANVFFPQILSQDLGTFQAGINKTTPDGTQLFMRNNTIYDNNNNPTRALPSDWVTNIEAGFVHPLLQGRGTQYNRIAGPFSFNQYAAGFVNPIDGVMIQRIRMDQALADFEGGVINLIRDVETAYWELYFAYRTLDARKTGRDAALATWRKVYALYLANAIGGEAAAEAQSKAQFFTFRAQVETAFSELLRAENRLRYIMGLSPSDGRLIRPADEPAKARVEFDWNGVLNEGLVRRVEIRKKKWDIKQRELELIAARNHLLPRLDFAGQYRWLGRGDRLLDTTASGLSEIQPGSNAFESLTGGDFQEWELGLQFSMPIGNRVPQLIVRHHQLLMARERALLRDVELEISHQVADALRDIERDFQVSQTLLNSVIASQQEVAAVEEEYEIDRVTLDLLLDAQRRLSDAEVSFYRSLIDYNLSIMRLHERKGSLLEYNSVWLQEGPWPGKAYFDALRLARRRDASVKIDYGFTRPNVVSRGPVAQGSPQGMPAEGEVILEGPAMPQSPTEELPPAPPENGGQEEPDRILPEPEGEVRKRATPPMLSEIFGGSAEPIAKVPAAMDAASSLPRPATRDGDQDSRGAADEAADAKITKDAKVDLVEFQSSEALREPKTFNPLRTALPASPEPATGRNGQIDAGQETSSPKPIDIGWREAGDEG
jgi:outer membrane protein TolC